MKIINCTYVPAQQLSRMQNAFFNPKTFESKYAEVISTDPAGVKKDRDGVDLLNVTVRVVELPGQPIHVTAKDCLATQLAEIAKLHTPFSFVGNVAGRSRRGPYVFLTQIVRLPLRAETL